MSISERERVMKIKNMSYYPITWSGVPWMKVCLPSGDGPFVLGNSKSDDFRDSSENYRTDPVGQFCNADNLKFINSSVH